MNHFCTGHSLRVKLVVPLDSLNNLFINSHNLQRSVLEWNSTLLNNHFSPSSHAIDIFLVHWSLNWGSNQSFILSVDIWTLETSPSTTNLSRNSMVEGLENGAEDRLENDIASRIEFIVVFDTVDDLLIGLNNIKLLVLAKCKSTGADNFTFPGIDTSIVNSSGNKSHWGSEFSVFH